MGGWKKVANSGKNFKPQVGNYFTKQPVFIDFIRIGTKGKLCGNAVPRSGGQS